MVTDTNTHTHRKDLHGVLAEGDGVEALLFLQHDGGGGTQASWTLNEKQNRGVKTTHTISKDV